MTGKSIAHVFDRQTSTEKNVLCRRCRQITGRQIPFGGLCIIISGDFHQLPPVEEDPIYLQALKCSDAVAAAALSHDEAMTVVARFDSSDSRSRAPRRRISQQTNRSNSYAPRKQTLSKEDRLEITNLMNDRGVALFREFIRIPLTIQHRIKDIRLLDLVTRFRNGDTAGLEAYLREHILRAQDASKFINAPVISPGNPERIQLTPTLLQVFADSHGERIISWNNESYITHTKISVVDTIGDFTNGKAVDTLKRLNPQLVSDFCRGTPISLLSNIRVERGLAHGSKGEMYALEWSTPELTTEALQFIHDEPGNVFLPDRLRPSAVLVRILLSPAQRETWLRDTPKLSRVEGDVVIPVDTKTVYVKLVSIFGTKLLAASITMPQYELDFIGTVHKCQGKTLQRGIISLLKRYGNPIREDYHSIYVALTRFCDGDGMRILADKNDLHFVNDLHPPHELLAFLDGYDSAGVWNRQRALRSLETRTRTQVPHTPQKRSSSAPPISSTSDLEPARPSKRGRHKQ